jgi:hypothetical protein
VSAGIPESIPNARAIHATQVFGAQGQTVIPGVEAGAGDQWAWIGRQGSGRQNPMSADFRAKTFGADGNIERRLVGVTGHDAVIAPNGFGYLDRGTEEGR